jgi:lipopolysaccharide biosynthesis protein
VSGLVRARRGLSGAVRHVLQPSHPVRATRLPAVSDPWSTRDHRAGYAFPAQWGEHPDLPIRSGARVATIVHVYYADLLHEIARRLVAVTVPFDLLVTNASGRDLELETVSMPQVRGSVVLGVENRGRDIWPLVQLVNAGLLDGYELILKVHTKRSGWRAAHPTLAGTGSAWRSELLGAILAESKDVDAIIAAFDRSPELGVLTADGSVLGPAFWGRNRPMAASLLKRLGLRLEPQSLRFAAGSMYWARASILRRLADLGLGRADFEDEAGQVDGTTAHALERVIGILATGSGLRVLERSELPDVPAPST